MHSALPDRLTLEIVIQPGLPLSHGLRQFFTEHMGASFRSNQVLRNLFKAPNGNTLGHARALYRASLAPAHRTPVAPQFQFNQHMQSYFRSHPQGTRAEALAQWEAKKGQPGALEHSDLRPPSPTKH
ncbi:MAG: hypothetical protein LW719_12960 [Comamonadaceae bacterium]|nr:hypothetical protein [Comamonadaceae bacterium]